MPRCELTSNIINRDLYSVADDSHLDLMRTHFLSIISCLKQARLIRSNLKKAKGMRSFWTSMARRHKLMRMYNITLVSDLSLLTVILPLSFFIDRLGH